MTKTVMGQSDNHLININMGIFLETCLSISKATMSTQNADIKAYIMHMGHFVKFEFISSDIMPICHISDEIKFGGEK